MDMCKSMFKCLTVVLFLLVLVTIISCGSKQPANLLVNGTFDQDASGWKPFDCTLASVEGGQAGRCLEIRKKEGSVQYASQRMEGLEVGKNYKVVGYVKSGTSGNEKFHISIGPVDAIGTSSGQWTAYSVTWKATEPSAGAVVMKDSPTEGTMLFDSCVLSKLD